jgi:lysophospholipase L1-like esterase
MTRLTNRSRAKVIHKKNILRFCVAVLGVTGSLIAGEILLRAIFPEVREFRIWPPGYSEEFLADDVNTPGVKGVGKFTINSLGLRSREILPEDRFKLLCLGGSTTIDLYLDDAETWTACLEEKLNRSAEFPKTWVGNCGKSSMASLHNLLHIEHAFPFLPRPDLVVILVGVNDLHLYVLKTSYMENMTPELHLSWAFSWIPHKQRRVHATGHTAPFYEGWALYALGQKAWKRLEDRHVMHTPRGAGGLKLLRDARQGNATLLNTIDETVVKNGEKQFSENLTNIVQTMHRNGIPVVFCTQPTLWSENPSPGETALYLAGGVGPHTDWIEKKIYYSPKLLNRLMEEFNDVTRRVCRENNLLCVDLARLLPKKAEYFYDDMHFSEAGARQVAEIIGDQLIARYGKGKSP